MIAVVLQHFHLRFLKLEMNVSGSHRWFYPECVDIFAQLFFFFL